MTKSKDDLFAHKIAHKYDDEDDSDATRAFSNFDFRKESAPGSYKPASRDYQNNRNKNGAGQPDLISRITDGPGMALKQGRLNNDSSNGFSIKGKSDGISIRGASQNTSGSDDLFPNKKKSRNAQRWQGDPN